MQKVAIITDSNSGITQKEAKEMGIYVLPMPFVIEGETYYEEVSITRDEFFAKMREGIRITTSQPILEEVTGLWNEAFTSYEEIVYIPMSSGLSGSFQTASMLAQDYCGRVQVVNNQRISVTQRRSVEDALCLAKDGKSAEQIKQILEEEKFKSSIYILLDTLTYLKQGGRITPAAAALGNILRIKPVLQIQGEKLDAFAKVRTLVQGKQTMIKAMEKDIESRFGGMGQGCPVWIDIAHSQNEDAALIFKEECEKAFPGAQIRIDPLSLSVATHIGPGALAIACSHKLS